MTYHLRSPGVGLPAWKQIDLYAGALADCPLLLSIHNSTISLLLVHICSCPQQPAEVTRCRLKALVCLFSSLNVILNQPSGPSPATDMPRVYIGRLSYHVREKDIQRFFSGYGRLLEIDLKNGVGVLGVSLLSWGRVACSGPLSALPWAPPAEEVRGGCICGGGGYSSRRTSGRDKYGPPVRTEFRLIVENLSSRCSWQDLKDFMRQAGEVTYADAHKERTNEGVIEFRSYSDMKRALDKLDGTEINGRNIRLIEDKARTSHRRSYSGSRSRSRSRRRSRSRSRRSSRSRSRSVSKSRSRSRSRSKGRSRSRSKGRKSRSKSKSKPKSDRGSRSRSRSRSKDEYEKSRSRSRSRSRSPKENGKGDIKSKSRSRSQSRSKSPLPAPPSKAHSVSPPPKRASRSRSRSHSKSRSRSRSSSRD
ncbi:Serine/arginine-rich splicing factor 6 [Myotis brandtii]|uniref:Serine/arginine-rich splicing factor 6 n=2 Tax=Myotis TaxID=9434 RepID=S7PIX6_MYOBR|nr:Serine/arginine-rich splicing factor 6 [Myotis brandtii]